MFSVSVRDHVMIAHSLRGEVFGPAQRLHGATWVVDVELRRAELDADGIVADIDRATTLLAGVLAPLRHQNLDAEPSLRGINTTTEVMARWIHQQLAERIARGELGPDSGGLSAMRVTLHESHLAWAAYEAPLRSP
jgi:6-pyruvoyltetrahydropterin/6-carboxytetrahydropterin synthase